MNDMILPPGTGPNNRVPAVHSHEMASTAAAAAARARISARYEIALRQPRSMDQVRQDLLKQCRRPAFARSAIYRKPIGKGVEGLSIRFAETAIICMTNIDIDQQMVYEDDAKEVQRVTVTDVDRTNVTYSEDVPISKTVERSKASDDGTYISVRRNTYGNLVYTVPASDDDMLNKRRALISKSVRTLALRLVPGDLQEEAEELLREVRVDDAARDPDAERKRLADAFAGVGVKATQLATFLGHDIGTCSPAELSELRSVYGAIKDGETTWASVMENKTEGDGAAAAPPPGPDGAAAPASTSAAEKVKESLKARKQGKGNAEAPPPPASAPAADARPAGAPANDAKVTVTGQGPVDQQESDLASGGPDATTLRDQLMKAVDEDAAMLVIDRARHLAKPDYESLAALLEQRFPRD